VPAQEAVAPEHIDAQLSAAGWTVAAPGFPVGAQPTALCESTGQSATLIDTIEDIRKHDDVLTPGRDMGAAALEDDEIPFEAKMTELRQMPYAQTEESAKRDEVIRKNLEGLGYAN
jgi:hypothetical protein